MINYQLRPIITALDMVDRHLHWAAAMMSKHETARAPLNEEYKGVLENNVRFIQKECRKLSLQASDDRITHIWNQWHEINPTGLFLALKPLAEAMDDELGYLYFFHYPKERAMMLLRIPGDWHDTIKSFPTSEKEITTGVDCYALGHNCASVFHMMRVAEIGLRALARERKVVFPKHPLEWAEWNDMIERIEVSARSVSQGLTRGPKLDAIRTFYSSAIAQLKAFKETRNRVSHMRGDFDDLDAQRAIRQVRDFMDGLSVKISEKTNGPIRKWV